MEAIAEEEKAQQSSDQDHCDSFWPEKFPQDALQSVSYEALPNSEKFLPCHYFDLICGSSTGG